MRRYLSPNVWYDSAGTYYVVLDVAQQIGVVKSRMINGVELFPKAEYHVSLVATKHLTDDIATREALIADIREFLLQNPTAVQLESIGTERYFCQKGSDSTLIAPVSVAGMDRLAAVVRERLPDFEVPYLHVTMLKNAESEYGIGIKSRDKLEEYCVKTS